MRSGGRGPVGAARNGGGERSEVQAGCERTRKKGEEPTRSAVVLTLFLEEEHQYCNGGADLQSAMTRK